MKPYLAPRHRVFVGLAMLPFVVAACWFAVAAAGPPEYTLDTDPIRLGKKALESGDLVEAERRFAQAVADDYRLDQAYFGLAQIAVRRGRYTAAEADYRRALAAAGDRFPEARAGLGLLLLRLDRDAEAQQEFQRALATDDDVWAAHYGLARQHLAAGEWEQARTELEHGRQQRGVSEGEDAYQHGLALYRLGTGDPDGAEKAALLAMHLNPSDAEHGTLVARIYAQQGDALLAIQAYEQALATPGMTPTAPLLHDLGNLYRQQQRYTEARDRYVQAVAADSTYTPVLEDLADLLRSAKRWDTSARSYLQYLDSAPEDTSAWLGLSESLYELGRYDQAADAAAKARQLDPESDAARFAFARAGIRGTEPALRDQAAAVAAELPADLPWQADDWIAAANQQTRADQFDAARASLARAAALDPQAYEVPLQEGIIALETGDPAAAVGYFQRAIDLAPDRAAGHLNLGIALYQAGRLDEAIPAFRRAAEADPNLTLAGLLLGQTLAATGELAEAEVAYQQVLDRESDNAKALRGVGYCRLRRADYRGAANAYQAATAAEPDNADGWAGLGSAQLGLGQLDAAGASFARARAIDPQNVMLQRGAELLQQAISARKENESR